MVRCMVGINSVYVHIDKLDLYLAEHLKIQAHLVMNNPTKTDFCELEKK